MIYSFSRLSLYATCPYRFFLKYILGYEEPVTKPLALGKAVHKGVEMIIREGLSIEEAAYEGYVEADFHPELTYEEIRILISNAPVHHGMGETEVHFVLPLSDAPSAPKLQGYIDLVQDGSFTDWKTNWHPYDVWDTYQLPLYAWAYMRLYKTEKVKGSLYFLRYRKVMSDTFDQENTKKAVEWAYALANEIEDRIFLYEVEPEAQDRLFPATPSSHCATCPYALHCYRKNRRR